MKFIGKLFNKMMVKYYQLRMDICQLGFESAEFDDRPDDYEYWVKKFNKFSEKQRKYTNK